MLTATPAATAAPSTQRTGAKASDLLAAIVTLCSENPKTLSQGATVLDAVRMSAIQMREAAVKSGDVALIGIAEKIQKGTEGERLKNLEECRNRYDQITAAVVEGRRQSSAVAVTPAVTATKATPGRTSAPSDSELLAKYNTLIGDARADFLAIHYNALYRAAKAAESPSK